MCKDWLIKIQNPLTRCKLVIYEDGRFYVDGSGPLIGYLKPVAIREIKSLINEFLPTIKRNGYHVQEKDGFIVKFWDNSNMKRYDLKVKGWKYECHLLRILFNVNNFRKFKVSMPKFYSIMSDFLETKADQERSNEE